MDRSKQVYEADASGWQRGLYDDVKATLRAPTVNSIWRIQMHHVPEFLRYAWGQIKPVFQTREFAAFSVAYRDILLSAVEDALPRYDPASVDVSPSAFTELRGQLATFDAVSPRLIVLFKLVYRRLNRRSVGSDAGDASAATAPFPEWLDDGRGRPPTMLSQDDAREVLPESLEASLGDMVPSIYRVLAQWPSYLERAWTDLEPRFQGEAYLAAQTDALELADTFLDRLPYTPRVGPDALTEMGFDDETISAVRDLYETFVDVGTRVVPRLPVFAATVDAAGERDALTFPE
ncbi:halocarboxylic acid dehydrogenase DehI family protein [Halosimplex amylolyticum]|uniref:halocarboxylic acid dehydrogenase DehI family protein n=1 Tax=Halosimplex amylolyticum TaxID=3396616 RepID=UPI003F55E215